MAEMRKWVDLLLVIEFAVNNTPNRTTGYTAFYLNYGFHQLHPLQLFNSPGETKNEFVLDCPVCDVEKGSHLKPRG